MDDGLPWQELLGRSDAAFEGALDQVVSGRATRIELPLLTVGGSRYRVRLWRSGDGWVHGFFLPVGPEESDEGRRARGEAALLEVIPDFPHAACYVFDDRLRYIAAWGRDAGKGPGGRVDLVGKTLEEAWPDGVVGQLAAPYMRALSGRESDFVVRREGRVEQHWTAGTGDHDGTGACGVALVWDITERVTTEESLRLVGDSIEALPLGVTIGSSDREASIMYANQGFAELSGYAADEIVGLGSTFMFGDDADQAARNRIAGAIRDGSGAQEVLLATRADGSSFWDRVTVSPIGDATDETARFVAVHEDVSAHRRTGKELEERRRLGALGQLAGGIAHDMRNVLAGSGLAIEVLVENHDLPEPVLAELRNIHDRLSRGTSITDRLLSFARDHTFEREPVDLDRFVESRVDLLRSLLDDSIEIHFDAPDEPAWIVGNEGQLDQALINLAKNAAQAMREGGLIDISVRTGVPTDALEVAPPAREEDGAHRWVLVRVRDYGVGMSEDVRRRAFEPFFTTRAESGASGLGLASVYGVVKELGGVCWIQSREGSGCTVSLAFPQVSHEPPAKPAESDGDPEQRFDGIRILLADDDRTIRLAFTRFLELRGAEVDVVPDGAEGLERLRAAAAGWYDLVITDAVMPHVSGQELLAEARRTDPTVACVLMSGHTRVDVPSDLEGLRFLEKPFSTSTLSDAIHEALGRHAPGTV